MRSVIITTGFSPTIYWHEEPVPRCLQWKGKTFSITDVSDDEIDIVIYDWLKNENEDIVGIELHLPENHPSLNSDLVSQQSIYGILYPQIYFGNDTNGAPMGLEAFGDIFFYSTLENEWLIMVGVDLWLTSDDSVRLNDLVKDGRA